MPCSTKNAAVSPAVAPSSIDVEPPLPSTNVGGCGSVPPLADDASASGSGSVPPLAPPSGAPGPVVPSPSASSRPGGSAVPSRFGLIYGSRPQQPTDLP